jgi:dTDP-4-dehydrorhamnose reductase
MSERLRLLQIGATGQVARELLGRASRFGVQATALSRAELDLTNLAGVSEAVRTAPCDAVVIAAAYTAVDRAENEEELAFTVNADAPGEVARACAARGVPLVHISSDYVFSGRKSGPWVEADPIGPINVYGRSKASGEVEVLGSGVRAMVIRSSWVFSPYGSNFVKTMLRLTESARDDIGVVDDQHGKPTAAGDLAEFILGTALPRLVAGDDDARGVFHFAGDGETTWRGLAEAVFDLAGGPHPKVVPITTKDYPTPAQRPLNSVLDCAKIGQVFGVRPRSWRLGLAETLAALKIQSAEA